MLRFALPATATLGQLAIADSGDGGAAAIEGQPDEGEPASDAPEVLGLRSERNSATVTLLREFYAATLERYSFISFPVIGEEGLSETYACQLLDTERRNVVVRPFTTVDEDIELTGLYSVSMQPLSQWGGVRAVAGTNSIDVFLMDDPAKADLITACGVCVDARHHVKVWKTRRSDVEGCTEMYEPIPLTDVLVDLMGKSAPVL